MSRRTGNGHRDRKGAGRRYPLQPAIKEGQVTFFAKSVSFGNTFAEKSDLSLFLLLESDAKGQVAGFSLGRPAADSYLYLLPGLFVEKRETEVLNDSTG